MKTHILIAVALIAALSGCTDSASATKALQVAGYSNIKITGYDWFACGRDDSYSTGFTAISPSGIEVDGAVCQGLFFKGSTIRTH